MSTPDVNRLGVSESVVGRLAQSPRAAVLASALSVFAGKAVMAGASSEVSGAASASLDEYCPDFDSSGNMAFIDGDPYVMLPYILPSGSTSPSLINTDGVADDWWGEVNFNKNTGRLEGRSLSTGSIFEITPDSSGWTSSGGSVAEKYSRDDYDFSGGFALDPSTGNLVAYTCNSLTSTNKADICDGSGSEVIQTSDNEYEPHYDPSWGSHGRLLYAVSSSSDLSAGYIYYQEYDSSGALSGTPVLAVDDNTGRCPTVYGGQIYYTGTDSYGTGGVFKYEADTTSPTVTDATVAGTEVSEVDLSTDESAPTVVDCNDAWDTSAYVTYSDESAVTGTGTDTVLDGYAARSSGSSITGSSVDADTLEYDISKSPDEAGLYQWDFTLADAEGNETTVNTYVSYECPDAADSSIDAASAYEISDGLMVTPDAFYGDTALAASDSSGIDTVSASGSSAADVSSQADSTFANFYRIGEDIVVSADSTSHDGDAVYAIVSGPEFATMRVTGASEGWKTSMAPDEDVYFTGDETLPALGICGEASVQFYAPDGSKIGSAVELDGYNCAYANNAEESDTDTDTDADSDTDSDSDADSDTDSDADSDADTDSDSDADADSDNQDDTGGPQVDEPEDTDEGGLCSTATGHTSLALGLVGLAAALKRRTRDGDDGNSVTTEWTSISEA